jgi:hypothetical protein
MRYKVTLSHDDCVESPAETQDGFQIFSFNTRHINFRHPEHFGVMPDKDGDPFFSSKDENGKPNPYKKLYNRNLLFVLSCYQHSGTAWSLSGEGPQCQWDTCSIAGVLILDEKSFKGMRRAKKLENARSFLKDYSAWCNGEVYGYNIEDENGNHIDSCYGFYESEYMFECISLLEFGDNPEFEFDGDCSWLANYHSIRTVSSKVKKG